MTPTTVTRDELISVREAARRMNRTWDWTMARVKAGELPAVRIHGRWYVRNLSAHLDALEEQARRDAQRQGIAAPRSRYQQYVDECRSFGIEPDPDFAPAG